MAAFCKSHEGIKSCRHHTTLERGTSPRVAVLKSNLAKISRLTLNHSVTVFRQRRGPKFPDIYSTVWPMTPACLKTVASRRKRCSRSVPM